MRICIILAVAALGLAGCNANQGVDVSSRTTKTWDHGRYVDDNPYNPIQTVRKLPEFGVRQREERGEGIGAFGPHRPTDAT